MEIIFKPFNITKEKESLISFFASEEWPFHVNTWLSVEMIQAMIENGTFESSNNQCFWIFDNSKSEVGFLRLFDLDDIEDGYPLFDLRLRKSFRGQGIGKYSVKWLTKYLFEKYPKLERIAGTTRADNHAMRKIFRVCDFAKEGHYRKDWEAPDGKLYDTVKYGILREDWQSGILTPVQWDDEP